MIEFLTRSQCPLCDDVAGVLERWCPRLGLPLRVIDVDADDDLQRRWGELVPVVLNGRGDVLATGSVPVRRLVRRLLAERYLRGSGREATRTDR